jgi:signal transduction histidine kinase
MADTLLAVAAGGKVRAAWGPLETFGSERDLAGMSFANLFASPGAGNRLLTDAAEARTQRVLELRNGVRVSVTAAPLPDRSLAVLVRPAAEIRRNRALGTVMREAIARASVRGPGQGVQLLASLGCRVLPNSSCLIAIVDAETDGSFRAVTGAGAWAERLVGKAWPIESPDGEGLDAQRTVLLRRSGRSAAGGLIGMTAFRRENGEPYSEEESAIIDDFATVVAAALQRAELRIEADLTAARLQSALDVALDLAESLDPREVVRRLLLRSGDAVQADRGTLIRVVGSELVVEDSFDRLRLAAPEGGRGRISTLPPDSTVRRALETRRPVIGGGYHLPEIPVGFRESVADVTKRMAIPLVLGGEVVALLTLHRREGPSFGRTEIATLEVMGGIAALALRNAWLYAATQEAVRTKSDFLNMGAHELRTPLTVIAGYLSMLRDGVFGPTPARWEHALDMLSAKTAELGALVEDLLLASRIETGRLPNRSARFDLREVVAGVVERARRRSEASAARIDLKLPKRAVEVVADAAEVERVLDALLSNAVTYSTERPEVSIEVSADPQPRVSVQDRGRGVPDAERERIFERFYRLDDPYLRHLAGAGLGLYIARELARRHGGDVVLESSGENAGSRFTLTLPRPRPSP